MQRDNLEKFILKNREGFDQEVPGLKVWAGIDREISRRRAPRVIFWRVVRMAAAVVLLLFSGALIGTYLTQSAESTAIATLQEVSPEYMEMQQFYEQQIDRQIRQLASYQQGEMVLDDIAQIDKAMDELKQELQSAPRGQEQHIVENLIRTYQTKVQILERVLERIQHNNQETLKSADDEISI